MYVTGNDSLATAVLGSTDFYDMLSRVEMVKRIAEHDSDLIETLKNDIEQLETSKSALETEKLTLEIAQSKGACGKIPARYWLHGEYLLINGGKMSKSLGNVYLIKDLIERGYDPLVYRLFSYSCHYRNKLNFTWEGIESASKSLERLRSGYKAHLNGTEEIEDGIIKDLENRFI